MSVHLWYENGRLWARTPFSPHLPERFRSVGGRWVPNRELWVFPPGSLFALPAEVFPPEAVQGVWQAVRDDLVAAWSRVEELGREGKLLPEQVEDVRALWRAFSRFLRGQGPRGFLLANGTGTGKTYVYSVFALLVRSLGYEPLVVVPNEDILRQVQGVLARFGAGAVITTYGRFDPRGVGSFHALILDEAHFAKRISSGASRRGIRVLQGAFRAGFVLYVTATPFDRPWEAEYILKPTGFHRYLGYGDLDAFFADYGVFTRIGFSGGKEYYFGGTVEDLKRFHHTLTARGFMRKRLFVPDQPVEYEVRVLQGITPEDKALLAEVRRRLKYAASRALSGEKGIVMAHRTLLSRAMLERMKLKASMDLIRSLLEEGWHVLLFVQYRAEKALDLSTPEGMEALWDEAEARGGKILHQYLLPALYGLSLYFPSPVEMVQEAFGYLGEALAFYTGGETGASLRRTRERWDRGEVRLLVATAAKGGTGLSLHDTTGKRPTAQVVLTLPWTATQLDQVLGRVVRVGMKSPVRVVFPAAPVPFERRLGQAIAQTLATLGNAVRGGENVVPEEVVEAFLYDLASVDPGAFQRLLLEEEAVV